MDSSSIMIEGVMLSRVFRLRNVKDVKMSNYWAFRTEEASYMERWLDFLEIVGLKKVG